jgi:hypothetical protein
MRTEEVRALLEQASADVAEPDLAGSAWTRGRSIRRRRRRRTAMAVVAVVAAVVAAAVLTGPPGGRSKTPVAPTITPSIPATRNVPSTGTIAGMPYWVAPEPGAERYLDRIETPLTDYLETPRGRLDPIWQRPVIRVAAVVLRKIPGSDRFRPAVLSTYGRWAESAIELEMTRDADGNRSLPLDTTAVARDGERVAFPQPNKVAVLDATTGELTEIPVPSATIENVSWMPTGDQLLASGRGEAFRVVIGERPGEHTVSQVSPGGDPGAVTAPLAFDMDGSVPVLARYDVSGRRTVERFLSMPVSEWYGASFTAGSLVARSLLSQPIGELQGRTVSGSPQMIAVVEAAPGAPGRLLVLDDATDTTHRFKGCCSVLGWYDARTVLLESKSGTESWILGWDVRTGELYRVTQLNVDAVAIGPILR